MSSACAETSMITLCMPASTMRRSSVCVSMGSGVVRRLGMVSSPIIEQTVPIRPVLMPAASKMLLTRKLVVVLPLVPVMPSIISFSAGRPKYSAAT